MISKSVVNYLNRHARELFEGRKLTAYNSVYWANMVTREIYSQSVDADMSGAINGYKVADIRDNWTITASPET